MTIWQYQRQLIRRLLQWSLFSLGVGGVLMLGRRFWRDVGKQFIGWALIDLLIAYLGIRVSAQRRAELPDPDAPEVLQSETKNLRYLLEVNTLLDVVYMFVGRWLMKRGSPGTGLGILIQGTFLFLFDLFHAGNTPAPQLPPPKPAPKKRAPRKRKSAE